MEWATRSAAAGFCSRMNSTIPAKSAGASGDHRMFIRSRGSAPSGGVFRHARRTTAIQGGAAFIDLLPEPFVMVEVVRDQLLHDLARAFAGLRGDPVQLVLELRSKGDFHAVIVGGLGAQLQHDHLVDFASRAFRKLEHHAGFRQAVAHLGSSVQQVRVAHGLGDARKRQYA
jgi:hypothetical protein